MSLENNYLPADQFEAKNKSSNFIEKKETLSEDNPFLSSLEKSIESIDFKHQKLLPENYLKIQESFIKKEFSRDNESLTLFHGGPMKWDRFSINDGWLNTACYSFTDKTGADNHINFHILSTNCTHGEDFNDAEVSVNFASEDELKLKSYSKNGENTNLREKILTGSDRKQVIIRPDLCGSLAFPLISNSQTNEEITAENVRAGINYLSEVLDLKIDGDSEENLLASEKLIDESRFNLEKELSGSRKQGESRLHKTEMGDVYATEIISDSVWKSFDIYSAVPLDEINLDLPVYMRIDSGCDIGMYYMDGGCDCHSQLLSALSDIRNNNGLIIHLPTQDGRGYGANSKIHTEGLKHGINPVSGESIAPLSTIRAAESIFGGNYDIRSYSEVGRIVADLGIKKAKLFTDNNKKLLSVISKLGRENVEKVATNSIEDMIANGFAIEDIIQMFLKSYEDKKYHREDDKDYFSRTANKLIARLGAPDAHNLTFEGQIEFLNQSLFRPD